MYGIISSFKDDFFWLEHDVSIDILSCLVYCRMLSDNNGLFDGFQPPPNPNRFAILSTRLLHSNLSVIHYSVFFQMCRAHGIGFDMKVYKPAVYHVLRTCCF